MAASIYQLFSRDSMRNFLAGFGMPGRDKLTGQRFVLELLDQEQLDCAYRLDWIARKVVDIPAFDSCRAWREWQADPDQIEAIEECEKGLGIQRKMIQALIRARLYGGAALIIGIDGQPFEDELDLESVGQDDLKFVHVVYALGDRGRRDHPRHHFAVVRRAELLQAHQSGGGGGGEAQPAAGDIWSWLQARRPAGDPSVAGGAAHRP